MKLYSLCCFSSDNTPGPHARIAQEAPSPVQDRTWKCFFYQENAPSHTAARTQLEVDVLGLQRAAHPPYSPDLAPQDFDYIPQVKSHLRGKRQSLIFHELFEKYCQFMNVFFSFYFLGGYGM